MHIFFPFYLISYYTYKKSFFLEQSSGKGASLPTTSPFLLVGLSLLFIASKLFDEINN